MRLIFPIIALIVTVMTHYPVIDWDDYGCNANPSGRGCMVQGMA